MLSDYIKLGQRIELQAVTRVKLNEESPVQKVYLSKVYDILSDERLEITMPVEQGKLILLSVDTEYEMFFYGEHGPYECVARIVDRYKSNNVYILVMELTTNLRKYQRREFYRHTCAMDIETRLLSEEELEAIERHEEDVISPGSFDKSILVDISGGGLRFVTLHKYDKDSIVLCKFKLWQKNELKEYEILGWVLDVKKVEKRAGYYEHRIQYVHIPKHVREEIIRYIFEEERKNQKVKKDSNI